MHVCVCVRFSSHSARVIVRLVQLPYQMTPQLAKECMRYIARPNSLATAVSKHQAVPTLGCSYSKASFSTRGKGWKAEPPAFEAHPSQPKLQVAGSKTCSEPGAPRHELRPRSPHGIDHVLNIARRVVTVGGVSAIRTTDGF